MTIDEYIELLKSGEYITDAKEDLQLAEWLEELKTLRAEDNSLYQNMAYEDGIKQGRADAKKEINEIMDMDVPISNVLYEIDKWLKEKKNE